MAATKRVGFAVVGLGNISQVAILPAFRNSRKARLIAVVSGDERKAKRLAARFGASDYYSYNDYVFCLNHPQVDAVFIATTNGTHADLAVRAANAGRHVLCEKPMANSVEECQQMISACRSRDVRLMIAYRKYFDPASIALKKLVTSGKLGRLKLLQSAFTINLPRSKGPLPWHLDPRQAGGGSLYDVGVYCVNTSRWLIGQDPKEVFGLSWAIDPARFREVDENIAFQLRFPEGVVLQASSSFGLAQASYLYVHGEKGWAALNPAYEFNSLRCLYGKIGGKWFEKSFKPMDEFALELDAFADAIQRRREPEPSGLEGLKDIAVMRAIYRSAREGRAVPVPLP